jgi:hypothetical protein
MSRQTALASIVPPRRGGGRTLQTRTELPKQEVCRCGADMEWKKSSEVVTGDEKVAEQNYRKRRRRFFFFFFLHEKKDTRGLQESSCHVTGSRQVSQQLMGSKRFA